MLGTVVLAALLGLPAAAETPSKTPTELTEVARVRLVLIPTSVTNRKGRPVQGLERQDFRLEEDGVPRNIDFFATERDTPIALAFLLDVSGSMKLSGRLDQAKASIRAFVAALDPADSFGLICFADHQVEWVTPFTSDREMFLRRLEVQEPNGKTALYDALAASPGLVDEEIQGRKAIVLFTDGLDNASELPMLQAVWLARRVNVPIYTLSYLPMRETLLPRRARDALRVLGRFSEETGGAMYPVHGTGDLTKAVAAIQDELRFQYVIGYYPPQEIWDGKFHSIRLETVRDSHVTRSRRGYYANP